ncbi:helix-turn-helix domain-containing protein [Streptacidiphilus fuscans]|uniref:Helix-turn-helix transcriptional regulator n=1 Tax=Streptacidiphilus fuscans TaxID=2789292 RepID=A0A931B6L0_9ACTN|nr:helix-turn-helix transcriptional regulator [Streptacidiphilus fuscans]MBF9069597.1 helix-turn-helix transcriptional regulator [Streptacidiphilus fuscans]
MESIRPRDDQTGEDLAALLRSVLAEHPELTQKQLAESAGIPYATLNAWVTGRRGAGGRIASDDLRALADALPTTVTVARVFAAAGRRTPSDLDAEREARLLELFHELDAGQQRALIEMARALTKLPHARATAD